MFEGIKALPYNVASSLSCETGINGSRRCTLYPPSSLPPSISAPFYGYLSYGRVAQRKVERDIEVTKNQTGNLLLRKPRTNQLTHTSSSPTRSDLNNGNSMPDSFQTLRGFFYIPQNWED